MGQAPGSLAAQLEERYFKQKVKLGEGSFGTVWRAVDKQTGQQVAIKQIKHAVIDPRTAEVVDGQLRHQTEREIALLSECKHDSIMRLYDTFEDADFFYVALEYCDGGDFGDKLKERGLSIGEHEAAHYMKQMTEAICVLHTQHILHRDIKPDNFMVQGKTRLKLSDFGLAVRLRRGVLLDEHCGTPVFMSPEQAPQGGGRYAFPADIWALGISMYMLMFGGLHPFYCYKSGRLDQARRDSAALDFSDPDTAAGSLGLGETLAQTGIGDMGLRYSEEARQLCRQLLEPHPGKRAQAWEAVKAPWLKIGKTHAELGSAVRMNHSKVVAMPTPLKRMR